MRLIIIIAVALLVVLGGGFAYIASSDVDVEQQTISHTLPNECFYNGS